MAQRQPKIPGLEVEKKQSLSPEEMIAKLAERVLKLELEVSLLRILLENPQGGKEHA